jgi:uncharacterized protein (TIRG00374 family)
LINNLRQKLIIGFGLGFTVFLGLILYGDIQAVGQLLQHFRWSLLPAILGLTLVNYILRGFRFHYYLYQIGITNISLWASFRVFLGGFALTITPGKVGELIRVLWLKNMIGADPVRAAPSTIVDRIVDGLAMALLASLGALVYPQYRLAVLLILAIIVGGIAISQIRPLVLSVLNRGERLSLIARFVHSLHTLYETIYELLRLKNLLIGVGIGLVSWSAEGLAFYLVLAGLGVPGSFKLVLLANFTLALSSILGGASSMPGGLGAAEATMAGILQGLLGLSENVTATATLLIRFFTLWFAVGLGILTVVIWRKMFFESQAKVSGRPTGKRVSLMDEVAYEKTG